MNLALKALPQKVESFNIYRIELINFNLIQKSLIAFQNDDQDELFNYYDNRQKSRLRKISKKAAENDSSTEELRGIMNNALSALDRLTYILGTTGISNILSEKEKQGKNATSTFMKVVPLDAVKDNL